MIKIISISLIIAQGFYLSAQTLSPVLVCEMPEQLIETSGLLVNGTTDFWSFEDSGNPEELYQFNQNGSIVKTVKLSNASNKDWEEMTSDDQYSYIGDFGNNTSNRKDLVIYKITKVQNIIGTTVTPQKINFKYEDQIDFNPPIGTWEFDCEAMISIRDSLYLFSKDYTFPLKGQTKIYKLSKSPGNQTARLVHILPTSSASYDFGQITAAAISPDNKNIILLANNGLYILDNFNTSNFWNGSVRFFKFDQKLQREAVAFLDNKTIYLTNEENANGKASLWQLNLSNILTQTQDLRNDHFVQIVYAAQARMLDIRSSKTLSRIEIMDSQGRIVSTVNTIEALETTVQLNIGAGLYFVRVIAADQDQFIQKILAY